MRLCQVASFLAVTRCGEAQCVLVIRVPDYSLTSLKDVFRRQTHPKVDEIHAALILLNDTLASAPDEYQSNNEFYHYLAKIPLPPSASYLQSMHRILGQSDSCCRCDTMEQTVLISLPSMHPSNHRSVCGLVFALY